MTDLRPVFYVSDGTGITAETIGHSLLTQFANVRFVTDRLPFVDTLEKAHAAAEEIRQAGVDYGLRPVVVNSCVDPALNAALAESGALMLDVFAPFIEPLERELGQNRQRHVGRAHGMVDFERYHRRIDAINFTLTHDDGQSLDYSDADLVLVAVSRAGKTPTCLYLALHYGVSAANYPLTEEDLEHDRLPPRLRPYRDKLFGLTIEPTRLHQIRSGRRPGSRYASLGQCEFEVRAAEGLFQLHCIPSLNTTECSIEEIARRIFDRKGIERRLRP
jgi:regulator of PEP synthase PpsR (kinase-PPPase family)